MDEIKLNYLKDSEGNYIIKQKINDSSYNDRRLMTTGTYSENLIISNKYFEKKLEHKLEDIVKLIEEKTMLENKISRNDFLSERFILDIKPEEEFNPIFKIMTEEEAAEYTKNSKKVRININFEIDFKIKPHLWFKVFLNLFGK